MNVTREPVIGATCQLGNGKTLWEIVERRGDQLVLSALGKGGYVNRNANTADVNDIQEQTMEWPLYLVLSSRTNARTAAHALWDRLRFSDPGNIYRLADEAESAARLYALACENHSRELVDLNIKEG